LSEPNQKPQLKYQCASCFHDIVAEIGDICRRCRRWDVTVNILVTASVLGLWGVFGWQQRWCLHTFLQVLGLTLDIIGVFLLWKGLVERFLGSLISGSTDLLVYSGPKHMKLRVVGMAMIAFGFALQGVAGLID